VSVGPTHSCATTATGGQIQCWGWNNVGQSNPPAGSWSGLTVGDYHGCVLDALGQTSCWGLNNFGQLLPPLGSTYEQLSAGNTHTCGLDGDGLIDCWGSDLDGQSTVP
jgi:alpha-tubulin suppressor-like RCC1 family protein